MVRTRLQAREQERRGRDGLIGFRNRSAAPIRAGARLRYGLTGSAAGAAAYTPLVRSFESVLIGQECLSDARILEDQLRMLTAAPVAGTARSLQHRLDGLEADPARRITAFELVP